MSKKSFILLKKIGFLTAISCISIILSLFFDQIVLVSLYKLINTKNILLTRYLARVVNFSWARIGFWFIIFLTILLMVKIGLEKSFKYRYLFALFVFIYLVIGQYHGSSIGFLSGMLEHTDEYNETTLIGINQGIRGDEWGNWLPLKLSQYENNFKYRNYNLMIEGCDTMVSGKLPAWDLMGLTRQKNWGYYFLPSENAVAFEWWSSLFLIFLSSIDLMYEFTHRKKLSILYAIMIIFSPAVQWWNSLWVIIYTGQYFIVALSKFLNSQKILTKVAYTALASISAISYIFDLYPAWQIPFAYVFLILGIWLFWKNKEYHPFQKANWPYYIFVILVCAIFSARFLALSKDAMLTQLNTTYPGGGEWATVPIDMPLLQIINFFMAFGKYTTYLNNCEISQFFGMLLWTFVLWLLILRKKDKNPVGRLITALFICLMFFLYFMYGPKIKFLYKITLLSSTYPRRVYTAFSYCSVLILFLTICESQYIGGLSNKWAKFCTVVFSTAAFGLVLFDKTIFEYMQDSIYIALFVVILLQCWAYIGYTIIAVRNSQRGITLLVILTVLSTLCVNPINQGIDVFSESTLIQAVKQIDSENGHQGRWIVCGNATIANFVSACGVKRASGVYIYPDIAMMEIIDPDCSEKNVWNRYASVDISIGDENSITSAGVKLLITVDLETAKALDIHYMVTKEEISETDYEGISFEQLYEDSTWYIYNINYAEE